MTCDRVMAGNNWGRLQPGYFQTLKVEYGFIWPFGGKNKYFKEDLFWSENNTYKLGLLCKNIVMTIFGDVIPPGQQSWSSNNILLIFIWNEIRHKPNLNYHAVGPFYLNWNIVKIVGVFNFSFQEINKRIFLYMGAGIKSGRDHDK